MNEPLFLKAFLGKSSSNMADDKFQFLQDPLAILPCRELLNETSLQVYIADVDGKLLWVNSSACDTLGYSQEQLLTMHIYDIDNQVTTTNWSDVVRKIRTDRRSVIQSEYVNKDGDVIHVEVTICLISSDNKEYCMFRPIPITHFGSIRSLISV